VADTLDSAQPNEYQDRLAILLFRKTTLNWRKIFKGVNDLYFAKADFAALFVRIKKMSLIYRYIAKSLAVIGFEMVKC